MQNYKELIADLDLDDSKFKSSIEKIQDLIINNQFSMDIETLQTFLDFVLNSLKLINSDMNQSTIDISLYENDTFIHIFSDPSIVHEMSILRAYQMLYAMISNIGIDYNDQKTALMLGFFEGIYKYKALLDNTSLQEQKENITAMLRYKNHVYGNAALNPVPFFTSVDPLTLIEIQLNNKVMRILSKSNRKLELEDAIVDLIGYLILYVKYLEEKSA
jgi:hypothetical protein